MRGTWVLENPVVFNLFIISLLVIIPLVVVWFYKGTTFAKTKTKSVDDNNVNVNK
jgi:hypothetical protein